MLSVFFPNVYWRYFCIIHQSDTLEGKIRIHNFSLNCSQNPTEKSLTCETLLPDVVLQVFDTVVYMSVLLIYCLVDYHSYQSCAILSCDSLVIY